MQLAQGQAQHGGVIPIGVGGVGEAMLQHHRELRHRERALSDTTAILEAARLGQVHQLCAAEAFEADYSSGEDPINSAVVETLRSRGDVFLLPPEFLPRGRPLAAILRY